MFFAKFSPAMAVFDRQIYWDIPESTATPMSRSDRTQRCPDRYMYFSPPSTESMLNRKIWGVSAFKAVVARDAPTATAK